MNLAAVTQTNLLGFAPPKRGKVRDIYDIGDELLIVATDRISCFDVVLPTPIPGKGEVLTALSRFWFSRLGSIVPHHLSSTPLETVVKNEQDRKLLEKRTMVVKKADPLPVEAIVRGYISGSGWKEYARTKTICGMSLPVDLKESEKLPETIFTPSTKASGGAHDENISFEKMKNLIGHEIAHRVRDASVRLYREAAAYAWERGIIIADTKFEFGLRDGVLLLIDEIFTPDSSRFWPREGYAPGRSQPSFDKQFVRDYLESISWNKKPPAPSLPPEIVEKTADKYRKALEQLTR